MTIGNLSHEIRKSQMRPGRMMVGLIRIHKIDLLGVKIEIYYQTIRVIIKSTCNHELINITNKDRFVCLALENLGWLYIIVLETVVVENIWMIYADKNIWQCHLIIGSMSVNHKKQVLIMDIKSGMQCSICHIPPKKHKNFRKVWPR